MPYRLEFHRKALSQWRKLDQGIRDRMKRKLTKRLSNPALQSARLTGDLSDCYKIRDNKSGFRLIYQLIEREKVLYVLAIGPRSRLEAYNSAARIRLENR